MGTVFTILVIALALFSVVAVMYLILREKEDHDAHLKYVRSPWADDVVETPVHEAGANAPETPAADEETGDTKTT